MSEKCYGIGAIGCGVIWNRGHWEGGLKHLQKQTQVKYVYDIDEGLAHKAAETSGATAVSSPDAIFAADDVHIVTVATPPYARVEYVRQACNAGKHLMLEKPMARTLKGALSIFESVRLSGVKCFIPFARATSATYQELVRTIESGDLGSPLAFVHTNLSGPYSWVSLDHWMHDMEKSGGPIFDYSVHFIELARACMGSEACEVCYVGAATTGRVRSDDHATLLVSYENGALGEFTKSWAFPPEVKLGYQSTHVVCQNAVAVLSSEGVEIHTSEGMRHLVTERNKIPGRAESYLNLIAGIESDTPLHASELEGLRSIEILDAGLTSRVTGKKEPVCLHN
jgi:predicted dehydrogenase